ncbi:PREDICTED: RNA-binding protein 12-like [Amphimedon queenslandica]|uniref:RRM domain-containing protein n=1 Tax=Amphimedon queenslandica TaxID=400682 RepID=A0A1X7VFA2_AMPQE|nr:PREDICTED: RNA-binding protein 12-like [Amphimedon queenslandica]|eukprot:XP_011410484.1 PREDICTED: RNA-binding protein 12-like [Amphimedon queenslandica]
MYRSLLRRAFIISSSARMMSTAPEANNLWALDKPSSLKRVSSSPVSNYRLVNFSNRGLKRDCSTATPSGEAEGESVNQGVIQNCLLLKGIPWETTVDKVTAFFGDLSSNIVEDGIHLLYDKFGQSTGQCIVHMTDAASVQNAVGMLNRHYLGNRYVDLIPCSNYYAKYQVARMKRDNIKSTESIDDKKLNRLTPLTIIKAGGLPFSANVTDLVNFFVEFNVPASNINIVYDGTNRSVGIAFVGFQSRSDAVDAVKKLDREYIGRRYVDLHL